MGELLRIYLVIKRISIKIGLGNEKNVKSYNRNGISVFMKIHRQWLPWYIWILAVTFVIK